jgi:hypothetical protein
MKSYILKFGKHKGQNFFDTPVSYQEWLLRQEWFKEAAEIMKIISDFEDAEEKVYQEKFKANQDKIDYILNNALSVIGKRINAYAWQYDNAGSMLGVISKVEFSKIHKADRNKSIYYDKMDINVFVDGEVDNSVASFAPKMSSFKFTHYEFYTLLIDGKLPKANRLLNSGVEAELI